MRSVCMSCGVGPGLLIALVQHDVKAVRFILGLVGFIVTWIAVAALVPLVVRALLPEAGGELLGVHWAAIPGSVVGVVAGYRVYQMISGDFPGTAAR